MTSVLVARHRHVRVAAPFDEVPQKRRRQKRHVAPDYQHLLRRRFDERRVKASERTRSADAIDHYGNIHGCTRDLSLVTIRRCGVSPRNSDSCRSRMERAPTTSALLSMPPSRRARPPARMAAVQEIISLKHD